MINSDTFKFLTGLKANNDKEWFDANRTVYNELRKDFEQFIEMVIAEIAVFDKTSSQTTAKLSLFRINRDIRFSNDKLPYKTNFGAFMAKGGRKSIHAGYYIHVEPGACFLSGGIYMPSSPVLKAIRNEIFENIDEFKAILQAPKFIKNFRSELWGEKLKTAPKGFPRDYSDIELLKYKHYTVIKDEPDSAYIKPGFIKEVREVFETLAPFNAFLNRAVDEIK